MTETSTVLKTFSRQDIAVSLEESPVFRHGEDVNHSVNACFKKRLRLFSEPLNFC